jgi:hypothetical protein
VVGFSCLAVISAARTVVNEKAAAMLTKRKEFERKWFMRELHGDGNWNG